MTDYIGNQLSIRMLDFVPHSKANITMLPISELEAKVLVDNMDFQSCFSNTDKAFLASERLKREFKVNRVPPRLIPGDTLLLCMPNGEKINYTLYSITSAF